MSTDWNDKAKRILEENIYITLSTSSNSGEPWISPLWAMHDENYTFYWGSPTNTKHSKLLLENPRSAVVVFDSKAPSGTGEGIYFEGKSYEITNEKELATIILKMFNEQKPLSDFTGEAPRRLYKFVPEKAWINAGDEVNGYFEDHKIELDIV